MLTTMKRIFLFIILAAATAMLHAQPKHEIRAAWLTTVFGLDWPQARGTGASIENKQKQELISTLDQLHELNFNTVLLQTRLRSDLIYPSGLEPFAPVFTGRTGKAPSFDPLQFVIDECHKRGMECHAWIVCIPAGDESMVRQAGKLSPVKRNPSLYKKFHGSWYLNPGNPETKKYIARIAGEITERYDIDGIHLDYIRYPEYGSNFPDRNEFKKYNKSGKSLQEWRRDNITEIVRAVYNTVKGKKRWVKVTCATIGKYRDLRDYSSKGWNALNAVSQDPVRWMREGITDMIYPMTYFNGNNFYPFVADWQENSCGRYVIPGLGIYFLDPAEKDWDRSEIESQIGFCKFTGTAGVAYYRTKFLTDNVKNLKPLLKHSYYYYPALQPAMTWEDSIAPQNPLNIRIAELEDGTKLLSWDKAADNDTENSPTYNIYASATYPVDTDNPANLIAAGVQKTSFNIVPVYAYDRLCHYAVTASDRYGNESKPSQLQQEQPKTTWKTDIYRNGELPSEIVLTDVAGKEAYTFSYENIGKEDLPDTAKGFYRVWCIYRNGEAKSGGYICR